MFQGVDDAFAEMYGGGVVLNAVLAERVDPDHDPVPDSIPFTTDDEQASGG